MNGLVRSIKGPNHKWWALVTVAIGTFMSCLDASIVNISLPAILAYFKSDLATIEWVVLAYLLAITALLLTVGRLADLLGRKRVYTVGFAVFTLGSLLCGLAASPLQLILARVFQAIGAAMLQANGMAITGAVFPAEERGRALGINGTVVATGFIVGPTIGGFLVSSFGWRSIFLVNVPIGVVGILMALLVLDERRISFQRQGQRQRFDLPGALVVSLALIALLFGLDQGQARGWTSPPILGLLAFAAAAFAAFVAVEARAEAPLMSLAFFRIRAFSAGTLAAFLSFLATSANSFLMPFFLELVMGYDPLKAGLLLMPTPIALAVIAPFSGWLSDRFGARILSSVGMGVTAVALVLLALLTPQASYTDVVLRLVLLGIGSGIFNSPNSSAVLGSIPRAHYGVASGFLSMVRNSGQVIGVALSGALLVGAVAPVVGAAGLGALQHATSPALRDALVDAFMSGFSLAFYISAALAAFGMFSSFSRGKRPPSGQRAAAPAWAAADEGALRDVAD
ncbi:MAG TPA: MFS transporter [Thermomicrobiales bacterium]|nr:MFS transporter [Thermomicrobiales bacterium]